MILRMSHLCFSPLDLGSVIFVQGLDLCLVGWCFVCCASFCWPVWIHFCWPFSRRTGNPFCLFLGRDVELEETRKGKLHHAFVTFPAGTFSHWLPFLLSFTKTRFSNVSSKLLFVGPWCCNFHANSWSCIVGQCVTYVALVPSAHLSARSCCTYVILLIIFLLSLLFAHFISHEF